MGWRSYQRGCASPAARPRRRPPCCWSNAGRCLINWSERGWRLVTASAPWSASTRDNGSPVIRAPTARAATPRCPSTCRPPPPQLRRVDPTTAHPLGREDGTGHRLDGADHPRAPCPSPAGLPLGSRDHAFGQALRGGTPGGGPPARTHLGAYSDKSLESILRQGLERTAVPEPQELELYFEHENIRGSDYYR
jgi:hypothetical protein